MASTTCHYLILALLMFAGLSPLVASATGAAVAAWVGYLLNRRYSFRRQKNNALCYRRYLFVALLQQLLNALLLLLLLKILVDAVFLAQVLTTAAVFIFGFTLNSYWSYRSQHEFKI